MSFLKALSAIRLTVTGARGPVGIDLDGDVQSGQFLVKGAGGSRKFTGASGTGADGALRSDLAANDGAKLAGYDRTKSFNYGSVGRKIQTLTLTPFDFENLVPGGKIIAGGNHTAAFSALAAVYNSIGCAIHLPDPGFDYMIDPDTFNPVPPASYNALRRRSPAISADRSTVIRARSAGGFLVRLGSGASDYTGYLRSADFKLGQILDGGFAFTKAPLHLPFFIDIRLDVRVVVTASKRAAWYGDATSPGPSGGLKGCQEYERDIEAFRKDTTSITNAVNPIITFPAAHGYGAAGTRICMALNMFGPPAAWNAIAGKSLDAVVASATTVQLLNVDTTSYGAFAGFAACYLNMPSMRVPKQITNVTNANPCVVTTAIPHLYASGDLVDLAEIGGMYPNRPRGGSFTGLQGQFTVTPLTATTFSIPIDTTSQAVYGQYNSGLGPGWAMGWVDPANCDVGAYYENATDIDTSEVYSKHFRIHQFHSTDGFDGKHGTPHFYNFPESGEALCHYYAGGDNHFYAIQSDGPFRYVLMLTGPNNTAHGCKTNTGYIDPRSNYGAFARSMNNNTTLEAAQLGLKGKIGFSMWSDFSGPGLYGTDGSNRYNQVMSPIFEMGPRRIAAAAVFSMIDGSIANNFQCSTSFARTPGGFANGDRFVSFLRPVPLTATIEVGLPGGSASSNQAATVEEDTSWSGRSVFNRRIISRIGGVPTDLNNVSVTWRYPF